MEGEGPAQAQVAQCLVNRFLYLRMRRPGLYDTLEALVRAYSQPVNPRWVRGGDRFEAAYRASSALQRRTMDVQHERRLGHQTRTVFSPETTQAVDKALLGSSDIPPNAVHFAAPGVGGGGMHILTKPKGANWLYSTQGSRFWEGYGVHES